MRLLFHQGSGESGQTESPDQTGAVADGPASDDATDNEAIAGLASPEGTAVPMTDHRVAGDDEEREHAPAGAQPRSVDVPSGTPAGDTAEEPVALGSGSETRQAVEQAYRAALRGLRGYPDRYLALIRAQSVAAMAEMRRQADGDVASIRRVLAMEVERLEQQAEVTVAQRRGTLAAQLDAETARLETELARAQADVAAFEARLVAFETETAGFLERMTGADVPAITTDKASPPATTRSAATQPAAGAEAPQNHSSEWHSVVGGPEADPSGAQTATAGLQVAGSNGVAHGPLPGVAAEIPVPQERSDGDDGVTADDAGAAVAGSAKPAAGPTATIITVRGLTEVASIAAFMRLLVRLPGVQSVQVRSDPNGEVSFAVRHWAEMDVRTVVESLPQFDVRVLSAAPGTLRVSASEPQRAAMANDVLRVGEESDSVG